MGSLTKLLCWKASSRPLKTARGSTTTTIASTAQDHRSSSVLPIMGMEDIIIMVAMDTVIVGVMATTIMATTTTTGTSMAMAMGKEMAMEGTTTRIVKG